MIISVCFKFNGYAIRKSKIVHRKSSHSKLSQVMINVLVLHLSPLVGREFPKCRMFWPMQVGGFFLKGMQLVNEALFFYMEIIGFDDQKFFRRG